MIKLKEGDTYVVAQVTGEIGGPGAGIFQRDTCWLSLWRWKLGPSLSLAIEARQNKLFQYLALTDAHKAQIIGFERNLCVTNNGVIDTLSLTNTSMEAQAVTVELELAADFRDVFMIWGQKDLDANTPIEEKPTERGYLFTRKARDGVISTLNVQMDSDEVYKRFISNTPADAVVIKMTWRDNPWASPALASGRERMKREDPDEYDNIWEGNPRSSVAGAIYAKEVASMIERKRARPLPYDPQLPVHTVWDLGWNDAMSIILVQRVSSAVMVIGYLEASGKTYAECVAELKSLKYVWGTDWLPHDGKQTRPDTGKNPKQIIEGLGRKSVKIIDDIGIENGIRAVRMMFPRLYIDNTEFKNDSWEFDGGARLIECLKRYRRSVPASTGEPGSPVHDEYSHGADSVRGLAVIVDQIINEGDMQKFEVIPSMAILDSVVGL